MWIAVCDDEKEEAEKIRRLIDNYAVRNDYDIHCQCFLTAKALLSSEKQFDMYFLDYQMSEMNGLELEKKLREEKNIKAYISFITAFPNIYVMQEAIKYDTHRFLFKPVENDSDMLYDTLNSLILTDELKKTIKLKRKDGTEDWIVKEDIICVEASEKSSFVTTVNGREEYAYLLKDIQERLPDRFFVRIQKSFVINLTQVKSSSGGKRTVLMKNGMEIPIGRAYYQNFNEAYLIFCSEHK